MCLGQVALDKIAELTQGTFKWHWDNGEGLWVAWGSTVVDKCLFLCDIAKPIYNMTFCIFLCVSLCAFHGLFKRETVFKKLNLPFFCLFCLLKSKNDLKKIVDWA